VRVSNGIQAASPHPLLAERELKKVCILMFTGDRGLAGAINANVLRRSIEASRQYEAEGATVNWIAVGKKGASSLQFRKLEVDKAYRGITDSPKYRDAEEIASYVIEEFKAEKYDRVVMVYNRFESAMSQEVLTQDLLPLTEDLLGQAIERIRARQQAIAHAKGMSPLDMHAERDKNEGKGEKHQADWFFEPDGDELLDRLLPTYVEQTVFRALLESTASEHGSRMSAMRNASENAGDIIDQLTLQRNRVRQAAITQEILEVVAGADAL
jgi:F-type H+-transporting ATPase subunit gamma